MLLLIIFFTIDLYFLNPAVIAQTLTSTSELVILAGIAAIGANAEY